MVILKVSSTENKQSKNQQNILDRLKRELRILVNERKKLFERDLDIKNN